MSKLTYQQRSNPSTRIPIGQRRTEGGQMLEDNRIAFNATASLSAMKKTNPLTEMNYSSPAMITQRNIVRSVNTNPYMTAQRQQLDNLTAGLTRQLKEEPLSGNFKSAQRIETSAPSPNNTDLPDNLKNGIESLSGLSMDNVKVHYNSAKPQQLNALAYAQGTDIHVGPGQEQHLPHEAWHVVQQAQGRAKPTMQMKGGVPVNDDKRLEQEADEMGGRALQMNGLADIAYEHKVDRTNLQATSIGASLVQRALENTSINNLLTLGPHKGEVEAYALKLSAAVESARDMIATKYFVHVPSIDGYMQNMVDNFNVDANVFKDGSAMPRQAGYWIESYATKIAAPAAGGGLNVILQAKRGNSRPDVVLQFGGVDIAWLDITSSASEGHIYDKDHEGWFGTPYVTEVTYAPLKLTELNTAIVPDKSVKDISNLLAAAKEAYKNQLLWEARVLEKYGFGFGGLMHNASYYVKENAVQYEEEGSLSGKQMDKLFSPDIPGNKFEKLALSFMQERAGKLPEPRELAAVIMYWNNMVVRYEAQFTSTLPPVYHLPTKEKLGLKWVRDISSADGEPIIRDWFPV